MKLPYIKLKGENSQTFFNIMSTAITSGITFLTMPVFTRLLGAEQYGYYSIFHAWLLIMACFIGLNVQTGIGTGYYHFEKDYLAFRNSTLVLGTILSLTTISILLVIYPIIRPLFGYSVPIFVLLLANAFATFVTHMANMAWVYEKHAERNMVLATSLLLLTTVISIYLLVNWNSDKPLYYARVIGTAIPHIFISLVIWLFLFGEHPTGYNKEYWKYSLLFGLPMVFHQLSHQVLGQSDRLMMQWLNVDGGQIGIYSFFYTFVAVLSTLLTALNTSWCPFLYDDLNDRQYEKINKRIKHYVHIFTALCSGFLLLSREVMKVFAGSDFWSGAPLVPVLVLVVYCVFFYQFGVNYEFFHKKPKYVAIGTTIAAVSNILLNAVMIPRWGMYGAATATLISYFLLAILHTALVKTWKYEKYPLSYYPIIIGFLVVIVVSVIYYVMAQMVLLRWLFAAIIGLHLVVGVYRRKTIF